MEQHRLRDHHIRLLLYGLCLLLIMALIFYMSSKSGGESKQLSDLLSDSLLGRILTRILPLLTENASISIRKYAHIFEFFCLGVSSFLFFYELFWIAGKRLFKTVSLAFLWSFLYACSDEWHQTFVPGRGGRILDLRFDAAGFLLGIILMCCLVWIRGRRGMLPR